MAGTLDQSNVAAGAPTHVSKFAALKYRAETITVGLAGVLESVDLELNKIGSPGDTNVEIWTENAGEPGAKVSDTATYPAASLDGTPTYVNIPITNGGTYAIGEKFSIVVYLSVVSSTNYIEAGLTTEQYAGGNASDSADASTWVQRTSNDLNFRTYMTEAGGVSGFKSTVLPYYTT